MTDKQIVAVQEAADFVAKALRVFHDNFCRKVDACDHCFINKWADSGDKICAWHDFNSASGGLGDIQNAIDAGEL